MKISVVIPALREKDNLLVLTQKWIDFFKKKKLKYELVYILDGTKEDSGLIALSKIKNKNIRLFYRPQIKGYGPSLKYGIKKVAADSDYVVTMDADGNHSVDELSRFLGHNEHIIIGSRYLEGKMMDVGPKWKCFLSKKMNDFMSFMYELEINDKTSGYRLYNKDVIDWIMPDIKSTGFEVLPEILIRAHDLGFTIKEIPITFSPRMFGKSKMNIKKTTWGYIKLFCRFWWR